MTSEVFAIKVLENPIKLHEEIQQPFLVVVILYAHNIIEKNEEDCKIEKITLCTVSQTTGR